MNNYIFFIVFLISSFLFACGDVSLCNKEEETSVKIITKRGEVSIFSEKNNTFIFFSKPMGEFNLSLCPGNYRVFVRSDREYKKIITVKTGKPEIVTIK